MSFKDVEDISMSPNCLKINIREICTNIKDHSTNEAECLDI